MIRVRGNQSALQRQLARTEGATRAAVRRTINKVGRKGFTLTLRTLAKATGLSLNKLRQYMAFDAADYTELSAAVKVYAHTFNVASVAGARQDKGRKPMTIFTSKGKRHVIRGSRRIGGGVIASPWGRTQTFKHAFLIQGGKTAMHRVGKSRYPIEPVWGPRVTREFGREQVDDSLRHLVAADFGPTMKHELDFALGRIGLKT